MGKLIKFVCIILALLIVFTGCSGGTTSIEEPVDEEYEGAVLLGMFALDYLKSSLNNPDSLKVYAMGYVSNAVFKTNSEFYAAVKNFYHKIDDIMYVYKIDYSYENIYGGTSREYIYMAVENDYDVVINTGSMFDGTSAIETTYDAYCQEHGRVLEISRFDNILKG